MERADDATLKEIFEKYATHKLDNQKVMKSSDFLQKYLGLIDEKDFDEKTLKILSNLIDVNKDGYIFFNLILFTLFDLLIKELTS